jgi:hypothetical protein
MKNEVPGNDLRLVFSIGFFLLAVAGGCRAMPPSLAVMVVGDTVSDSDVRDKADQLLGKSESAADAMFGARVNTLVDPRRDRRMLIYPTSKNQKQRYVVEVEDNEIVALTKAVENIDGAEDLIRSTSLRKDLLGKYPTTCRREAKLTWPILELREQATGFEVQIYDVRNVTNLRGARYCILKFDASNRCTEVKLVGVSASTKDDPIRG